MFIELLLTMYMMGSLISVGIITGLKVAKKTETSTSLYLGAFSMSWYAVGIWIGGAIVEANISD